MTTLSDYLNDLTLDGLRALFGTGLLWGVRRGSFALPVGTPVGQTLTLHTIAEAAGVPVFAVVAHAIPSLSARRAIFRALSARAAEHVVVYLTSDADQALFVSPRPSAHPDAPAELRALPFERGLPARTTLEQLAKLCLPLGTQPTPSDVRQRLLDAFDVEAVTQRFFNDYRRVFDHLQAELRRQSDDPRWAHDFALHLLNRLLFLYFIQRKRFTDGPFWLANDRQFILNFWRAYQQSRAPDANFYADWLSVLFFEAFNQRFQAGRSDRRHLPEDIREALASMPFLNGGLFTPSALDRRLDDSSKPIVIPDDFFELLFDRFDGSTPGFLERYNFTVSESTPLDVEVAVDPEMIGKVYENLVNLTERGQATADLRGSAGIFYTPRVEIDLMCRLALVHALAERLPDTPRDLLYDWVFAVDPDAKAEADEQVFAHNLWRALDEGVRSLTICDPACGSGSFLVGMLQVLDDLQARCGAALAREESPYQRRRRIVGEQLYGVDAMDWAVHVAELRLWLQLTVETDLKQAEAQLKPLLPNLSFKLRPGDSLVQELGGVNLGLHPPYGGQVQRSEGLPAALKGKMTRLKSRKLRFYQASRDDKTSEPPPTEAELRQEERLLFREVLMHQLKALGEREKAVARELEALPQAQLGLGVAGVEARDVAAAKRRELESERAALEGKRLHLAQALQALDAAEGSPFVWDIAFVEIFGIGDGFDIVIGNPPYVRKQRLAPPTLNPDDFGGETSPRWEGEKQRYREKLLRMAEALGITNGKGALSGWADLYVYFYFMSFSLLKPGGTLCFITPNAWLDVGYGRALQAFFLRKGQLKMVIDNSAQRSFSQAEVNTVIVLLSNRAPDEGADKFVRFVLFKRPFNDANLAATFKAVEHARTPFADEVCRVTPVARADLLEEATTDRHSGTQSLLQRVSSLRSRSGWGKYLRAPSLFNILATHARMIPLSVVATARLGVTTGANDFFFVRRLAPGQCLTTVFGEPREIALPEACLVPALRSVSECVRYEVRADEVAYHLFVADRDPLNPLVRRYIQEAEGVGVHRRPFFRGKRAWYELGELLHSRVVVPEIVYQRYFFAWNADGCALNKNFYGVQATLDEALLFSLLNFTFSFLYFELTGRKPGAGASGINVSIANRLPIVNPDCLDRARRSAVIEAAGQMRRRTILDLDEELRQPDRRALDAALLDALGMPRSAADDLYGSLLDLVHARLSKARSAERANHD